MSILTTADIAELRTDRWVSDLYDPHNEWGAAGSAKLAVSASAGADSLSLSGLGVGTVKRGTDFTVQAGSVSVSLTASADATITAGAAVISIVPRLLMPLSANDLAYVRTDSLGLYARVFGDSSKRAQFSDLDLETFAERAAERWEVVIRNASDTKGTRFAAISALAIEAKLASTDYTLAIAQCGFQDGGTACRAELESRKASHLAVLGLSPTTKRPTGPANGTLTK